MPDNPQPPFAHWFSLSDHRLISLEGRDAVAFAQAQTMNDVAALADGRWHRNGWLTPKGRVIALFLVLRVDAQTLWLVVPDADAGALVERLRRFVFRSKVAIAARDDLRIAGRLRASDLASGDHWAGDPGTAIELDLGELGPSDSADAGRAGRSLRIGPTADAPTDADALTHWRRADLERGWPRLDASQAEQWTPQQLSLERLGAYSVRKGCYPGQEIVARTHFLGQAKRGLALVRSAAPLGPGETLAMADGTEAGTVVSTAGDTALAVVPLELRDTALRNDESPAGGGAFWRFASFRDDRID
ncbi:MAG: YgfZ/GcvT domain-containing protein [Pseudomonadota bacterium]